MTRRTSARVAGATFLLYIALGISQMFIGRGATTGENTATKLASFAAHASAVRVDLVLSLVVCVIALTLAVALYGITRDEDQEIAVLALVIRTIEGGVAPLVSLVATLGLLWLAVPNQSGAPDGAAAYALAGFLFKVRAWIPLVAATFFALGSTLFCWLFLRGRMIPVALAWLGVAASILLVVCLPLQLVGVLSGSATQLMWIPMAAFELPLGFWLLIKGVVERTARS